MKSEQTISIKLELNSDEAEWLRNIMQNPLHGQHIDNEASYDRIMRAHFFRATTKGVDF
jgi:hypothetical protein